MTTSRARPPPLPLQILKKRRESGRGWEYPASPSVELEERMYPNPHRLATVTVSSVEEPKSPAARTPHRPPSTSVTAQRSDFECDHTCGRTLPHGALGSSTASTSSPLLMSAHQRTF